MVYAICSDRVPSCLPGKARFKFTLSSGTTCFVPLKKPCAFTSGNTITFPDNFSGFNSSINLFNASIPTYSHPWTPAATTNVLPGKSPQYNTASNVYSSFTGILMYFFSPRSILCPHRIILLLPPPYQTR